MIVLGIDPGATVGLAMLDVPAIGRPKWIWHGAIRELHPRLNFIRYAIDEGQRALQTLITLDVVAIESVDGYVYEKERGADLIKTARLEGKLIRDAQAVAMEIRSPEPLMVSRAQWRKALCRNGSAGDAIVKRALELQTVDMPKRTNAHARDAAGVAIVGARMAKAQRRTA